MTTLLYPSTTFGKRRAWLMGLAAALLLAPAAWAQITVPAGNPNGSAGRKPLGTYFGYERSAMIYTAAEISAAASGNITSIGFYLNAATAPGAAPTKVYLKTVANTTFAGGTTVAAEETGATLVYDATIPAASFTANMWVTIPLTTPFVYTNMANLEVIVETNATGAGNETSNGKVFRYASTGANSRAQFWQADTNPPTTAGTLGAVRPNIQLTGLVQAPLLDAAVQVIYSTGKAPVRASQLVQAVVSNTGNTALTSLPVTLSVSGANTFTDVKTISSLAVGASATVSFAAYSPAAVGSNALTVTIPADAVTTNNSQLFAQAVTANSLSYLDASQPLEATGVSVNSNTPNGILAAKHTINSSATINEVRLSFPSVAATTSTYQVLILDATGAGGTPGTVLFTSPTQSRTTAAGVVAVPVTGTVTVNGSFFVGVKEISGGVTIGYQLEDPLRPATYYFQGGGTTTWTDVSTTTFKTRLGLEVTFGTRVLATNSAALARAVGMYPNPSAGLVTLDIHGANAAGAMQVQVTNLLGQVVHTATVRDNARTTLDVSGLASGLYLVRVQSGAEYDIRQLVLTK